MSNLHQGDDRTDGGGNNEDDYDPFRWFRFRGEINKSEILGIESIDGIQQSQL